MAMNTYPMIIEDGHMYAKVTLRDVVEKCDVSDLPFLSEVKRLYDENAKLRKLAGDMWTFTRAACKKYPKLFDQAAQGGQTVQLNALDYFEQCMRELGIEGDDA